MTLLQAILIAIVEGLTEFLPVSSTGHMIIAEALLGVEHSTFTEAFVVNIQFGAILSVVVLYFRRFVAFRTWKDFYEFYSRLVVAFIPAAAVGWLLNERIDQMLGSVLTVAIALFSGGVLLLFIDSLFSPGREKEMSYTNALVIGFFQCVSMVPGVSRSAATIIGGLSQGLSRKQAAEFSFFLAVPTMLAASVFKLYKGWETQKDFFNGENLKLLLVGNAVAFVVAMLAIRFFVGYLSKHGFRIFGWYRIVVGAMLMYLLWRGVSLQLVD